MIARILILAISTLLSTFLAFYVYLKNPKKRINQYFSIIALCVAIWNFSTLMFWTSKIPIIWARLMFLGPIIIPPVFLSFSIAFPREHETLKGPLKVFTIALSILFIILMPTDFIVKEVCSIDREVYYGIGNILFSIYFSVVVTLGFVILLKKYSVQSGFFKTQLTYIFIGMIVSTVLGVTTNIILPLFGTSKLNYIGPSGTIFFVFMSIYAITRYRLLDIKLQITRRFFYFAFTFTFSLAFLIIVSFAEKTLAPLLNVHRLVIGFSFILLASVTYIPTFNYFDNFIDKTIYKIQLIAEKTANKFAHQMQRIRSIDKLSKFIAMTAIKTLHVNGAATFIYDEQSGLYKCTEGRKSLAKLKGLSLSPEDNLVKTLKNLKVSLTREDFEMFDENIYLVVPTISGSEPPKLLGFLVTDIKKDLTPFSDEEIHLLETIANQISAGIESSLLYKQKIEAFKNSLKLEKIANLGLATAGIAHDAKNALTFVKSFSELLKTKYDNPEYLKQYLKPLQNEAKRIKTILESIQNYANPKPPVIEKLNAKEIIEEMIVLIRDTAKGKNILIDINLPDELFIFADENKTRQIFLNLFVNALDAMPNGGILSISSDKDDSFVTIKVSDTGIGIPKETMKKIFEPFFTTKKGHGTGLGLSSVKMFIEEVGGSVAVESEVNKGTTFYLTFKASQ